MVTESNAEVQNSILCCFIDYNKASCAIRNEQQLTEIDLHGKDIRQSILKANSFHGAFAILLLKKKKQQTNKTGGMSDQTRLSASFFFLPSQTDTIFQNISEMSRVIIAGENALKATNIC